MHRLRLRGTELDSSEAGFGCVGLTSVDDRRTAINLLNEAFNAGVTHFDVARAYGLGRAEHILGEFLRSRRKDVTVTTKFGVAPPSFAPHNVSLVAAAKRVLRR